jgi:hypothetical protein
VQDRSKCKYKQYHIDIYIQNMFLIAGPLEETRGGGKEERMIEGE